MSEVIAKHSRMPRKLSRRTLRRREELAIGGIHALSEVDPKTILERYLAGEKIRKMAEQYGVRPVSIYAFLLRLVPDEWLAAQKAKAFARKEQGEDGLDDAQDALDVAIAREQLRAGQWDLERVMRDKYGREDHNININVFDLGERLRRAKERTTQVLEVETSSALTIDHAGALEAGRAIEPALDQVGGELEPGAQESESAALQQSDIPQ